MGERLGAARRAYVDLLRARAMVVCYSVGPRVVGTHVARAGRRGGVVTTVHASLGWFDPCVCSLALLRARRAVPAARRADPGMASARSRDGASACHIVSDKTASDMSAGAVALQVLLMGM
ncbi:hypothetical protein GUJ93_ZPchr0007g6281 [Zizania palustris]|uniref:Uncharacterized protein n=1 Tax=Zizania palustris TaxID=103762 RepID=A0A8J5TJD5_ZIZPA|nr:hypothetical protein GUJ93_ZPchr0007g6281 [Zizania palustris]